MGLSEEERKSVVTYRMEKAKETFAEMPILLENKLYRNAANRLYCACYYAVSALLINDKYESYTHSGAKTLFGLHYIKTGKIDKLLNRLYENLFKLRQSGDYDDMLEITEEDVLPLVKPVENFINTIEQLISNNKTM